MSVFRNNKVRFDASPRARLPRIAPSSRIEGLVFDSKPTTEQKFEVVALADGITLTMFGDIGASDGVTAGGVTAALRQAGNLPLTVKLNSYGGDYFEGVAIYNLLRAHPGPVTTQVLGLAASAASVIAIAADRVEIARNAEMMIHRGSTFAIGNADTMVQAAETLRRIDTDMAMVYAARTGETPAAMMAMMSAETWFNSQEAIVAGLADAELASDSIGKPILRAQSKRQLEDELRRMGYARAAASKMATAAYSALGSSSDDLKGLIDRIDAATSKLERKHNA